VQRVRRRLQVGAQRAERGAVHRGAREGDGHVPALQPRVRAGPLQPLRRARVRPGVPDEGHAQAARRIVFIEYAKCIGCCACIEHCPYHVRTLVQDSRMLYPDGTTAFEKPVAQQILDKVAAKCDLCYHRIEQGRRPACVEVCRRARGCSAISPTRRRRPTRW